MDVHDWSLLEYPFRPKPERFSVKVDSRDYEIDVDGDRLVYQAAPREDVLDLDDVEVAEWTSERLTAWIDPRIDAPDVKQVERLRWILDVVAFLRTHRGIAMAALIRCKYVLLRLLNDEVKAVRAKVRTQVFQTTFLDDKASLEISFDEGFAFKDGMYDGELF
jgi:type III restriction enzyme